MRSTTNVPPRSQDVRDLPFQRDNGMVAEIRLPVHLSRTEAARLVSYITSLVEYENGSKEE